jgi:hypothetical protein
MEDCMGAPQISFMQFACTSIMVSAAPKSKQRQYQALQLDVTPDVRQGPVGTFAVPVAAL